MFWRGNVLESCTTCKAGIIWAETNGGKWIPVDHAPTVRGNIVLQKPDDPRDPVIAIVLSKKRPRQMGELVYVSHFVTCPNAAAHRKQV